MFLYSDKVSRESVMLTIALFGAIFSSVVWLAYSLHFVMSSLSGMSFLDAGLTNVLLYTLFVCLPLLLLWAVFGYVNQYFHNKNIGWQMHKLFAQMKRNQEYSDLLARIMLESEQNIKNSFILSRFDVFIADMNELLSEFILRERLVSAEQNENLWIKAQNGGKWAFGKVLIENYNLQPSFQKKIFNDALSDNLLAGTVLEFCARYQTLISLLEKHDKEKMFMNIIETGVFGKVFAILAPIADEIRRSRDVWGTPEKDRPVLRDPQPAPKSFAAEPQYRRQEPEEELSAGQKINRIFSKFMPAKKHKDNKPAEPQRDAFSLALERSFSETPPLVKEEPVFDAEPVDEMPLPIDAPLTEEAVVAEDFGQVSNTDKTLNRLKKEWQDMDKDKPADNEEDLTYPFGGWTDADNYQK